MGQDPSKAQLKRSANVIVRKYEHHHIPHKHNQEPQELVSKRGCPLASTATKGLKLSQHVPE